MIARIALALWLVTAVSAVSAVTMLTGVNTQQRAEAARVQAQISDVCSQIPGLLAAVAYTQGSWPVPDTAAVSADVALKLAYFAEGVRSDLRWCDQNGVRENPETIAGTLLWHFGNASVELRAYQAATVGIPPQAAPVTQPGAIRLAGVGQTATQRFTLRAGLATFSLQHSGSRNFIVWLLNDKGEKQELLANVIGPFAGSKAANIKTSGDYLLDVAADGRWAVTGTQ